MSSDWPPLPALPAASGTLRSHPLPPRSSPLSPTSALRARQRMDAITQATSELSVLTEQLMDLPGRMVKVQIAAAKAQQLHEAMEAYAELAALAYNGMAEGQLHEVAASALYRQRAVAASRRISRLQQEAAVSRPLADSLTDLAQAVKVERPRARAPFWQLRIRLYEDALVAWRSALATDQGAPSSLPAYGRALEQLRAAVGFAGIPSGLLSIIRVLVFLTLAISGVIAGVTLAAATSSLTLQQGGTSARLGAVAVVLVLAWGFALTWGAVGRTNLRTVIGATRWRLVERERATALGLLSGWGWFAANAALLGMVAMTGYAGWLFAGTLAPHGSLAGAHDLASVLQQGAGQPLDLLATTAAVVLALPLIMALPSVLVYQGMHMREMARGSARLPQARRMAANFALPLLTSVTLIVLAVAVGVALRFPALMHPFVAYKFVQLSWMGPIVAGAMVLPYAIAVLVPYNLGMRRWRTARLRETAAQTQDLSAKLAKLGPQPELNADVTSVQYDVARLQYLQLHTTELRRARGMPFTPGEGLIALVIVLVVAVLADSGVAYALQHGLGMLP